MQNPDLGRKVEEIGRDLLMRFWKREVRKVRWEVLRGRDLGLKRWSVRERFFKENMGLGGWLVEKCEREQKLI